TGRRSIARWRTSSATPVSCPSRLLRRFLRKTGGEPGERQEFRAVAERIVTPRRLGQPEDRSIGIVLEGGHALQFLPEGGDSHRKTHILRNAVRIGDHVGVGHRQGGKLAAFGIRLFPAQLEKGK